MKITAEIPEDLLSRAKARASLEGIQLQDLLIYGLKLAIERSPGTERTSRASFPLVKAKEGSRQITDDDVAAVLAALDTEDAQL